ncbi:protein phosphatase 2C domain-containing protein [Streptacidiphilus sp. PAMC 29251]
MAGDPQPLDRFRFRVVVPEPGDVLLLCSDGLAQPLREEPAVSDFLADHWAHPHPPGTVDFLRHVQVRAKGYAADRTAAAIWED